MFILFNWANVKIKELPHFSPKFFSSNWSLQYGLGRGEGQEPCVLRNTTPPSFLTQCTASLHNALLRRKSAVPMCRRKHRTPGDRVSMHVASCDTAWYQTRICSNAASNVKRCLRLLGHSGDTTEHFLYVRNLILLFLIVVALSRRNLQVSM